MPSPSVSKLRGEIIRGIGWSAASRFGTYGLQFIIGLILARLLTPEAFGLIGMVMVFVRFADIYSELGFGSALVQKQNITPEHYNSIFWITIGGGFLLTALFMATAPLLARFYGKPILIPLTMLISLNFLIGSFKVIQYSIIRKQLNVKRLAIVNSLALALSGVAGITMALLGLGVWSLAWQSLILTMLTVLILWQLSDWRPAMRFSWPAVKELLQFSTNLLGFKTINYWTRNMDNLLIGRFLGMSALGLYSRAYSLMLLPLSLVSRSIGQVMFPALSTIQHDKPKIARIYLRMTRTVALLTFPLMIGLWVVADHFVIGVFGPQWAEMIPIVDILCVVGLIQSIETLNGNLYLSQGRSDLEFKVATAEGIVCVSAMVVGLRWGVVGVAYGYAAFGLAAFYPSIRIAVSLVGLTFAEVAKNLLGVIICALAMGITTWAFGRLLPSDLPHWVYLAVQVPFAVIVYGVLICTFRLRAYREVVLLIREQIQGRRLHVAE